MGLGPNYGLSKGFLATGTTAYEEGQIVEMHALQSVRRAVTADALTVMGVVMEDMSAARLTDNAGKIVVDVAMAGIVRVQAGGVVAIGDKVTNDATARAVTRARTAGGAQPMPILGIALTAAAAAGNHIDVLLTPGTFF